MDICELCDITATAKLRFAPGIQGQSDLDSVVRPPDSRRRISWRARFMILKQRVDVDNASRKLAYRQQKTCLYARVAGVPVGFRGLKHP
jgi:hypothetical protein